MLKIYIKGDFLMIETAGLVATQKAITDEDGVFLGIDKNTEIRDKGWKRVWLAPFFDIIGQLSKSQLKVLKYIIYITGERNNLAKCTAESLAICCKVSVYTAKDTLSILTKNDFLRKADSKKYMINPLIIFYGKDNMNLCCQYFALDSKYELKKYKNKEWQKFWLINFFEKIEDVSGKSMQVVYCLLSNMYMGNNIVKLTQRQIVQETGLSIQLVNQTLKKLKAQDLICYKSDEAGIRVNPECVSGVPLEKRINICKEYQKFADCS